MGSNTGTGLDDAGRVEAAMGVWKSERGFSGAVLLIGWMLKVSPSSPLPSTDSIADSFTCSGVLHPLPLLLRSSRPSRNLFSITQIFLQHDPLL